MGEFKVQGRCLKFSNAEFPKFLNKFSEGGNVNGKGRGGGTRRLAQFSLGRGFGGSGSE